MSLNIAHRGYSGKYPENTMMSFENAVIEKCDGIETDVQLTKDGEMVLCHVTDCALAGADIATVPYNIIEKMTKHPLTDQGIIKFQKDYLAVFGE